MSAQNNQNGYWDSNLDPANLDAPVQNISAALQREVHFAEQTPDIIAMMNYLRTNAAPGPNRPAPLIADIGAGLGTTAVLLTRSGHDVLALDISHNRLTSMRQGITSLSEPTQANRKIYYIKCKAEALPFRDKSLDGACTRAVLIHTDIPAACEEINRTLIPNAPVAFAEVLADNPLVNLYRKTLAPSEWKHITTYFRQNQIKTVRSHFQASTARPFYVIAFAAFIFQYALPQRQAFSITLKIFTSIDRIIARLTPSWWNRAWFILITGKARQR